MTFRKLLFWTHLIGGVAAGLVILVMSVTGVLLTYEKQIIAWADRRVAPVSSTARMGTEALLTANPGVTSVTVHAGAGEPVALSRGRDAVLVDPGTGAVLGPQAASTRAFFRSVTDWHRWLARPANDRTTARAITGASNLVFLALVISGLYLWLPRRWAWQNVRAVLWFRGGLAPKARDFNWHNVAGFWCCVPLFFVVLSGVVISYPWASDLVYQANGVQPPVRGKGKGKGGPQAAARASVHNLNALVSQAEAYKPAWKTISFAVPATDDAPVSFTIETGTGGQPQYRWTLILNRETGAIEKATCFAEQDAGQQARSWMRFVHTGEYYGIAGQTIAGLASAGGALLVWTGLALSYRRFRAWRSRT